MPCAEGGTNMKISLENLHTYAATRPAGYEAEVLAVATITEGIAEISDADFKRIHSVSVPKEPPQLPSLPTMAANLAQATAAHLAGGLQKRTDEEALAIMDQFCKPCEFFIPDSSRCSKCGCFLAVKTSWKSAHCPVNKW